jgi:hypothetical protein
MKYRITLEDSYLFVAPTVARFTHEGSEWVDIHCSIDKAEEILKNIDRKGIQSGYQPLNLEAIIGSGFLETDTPILRCRIVFEHRVFVREMAKIVLGVGTYLGDVHFAKSNQAELLRKVIWEDDPESIRRYSLCGYHLG